MKNNKTNNMTKYLLWRRTQSVSSLAKSIRFTGFFWTAAVFLQCSGPNLFYCDAQHLCGGQAYCNAATHSCESNQNKNIKIACADSSVCPATAPLCKGGICGGCASDSPGGASSECMTYHAATPVCGENHGCVECVTSRDCLAQGKVCSSNACVMCSTNEECTSGQCSDGVCGDPDAFTYVNSAGKSCPNGPGQGTLDDPFCSIGLATQMPTNAVVVFPGNGYQENLTLSPNYLYALDLRGVGQPVLSGTILVDGSREATAKFLVSIDGITIQNAISENNGFNGDGVYCIAVSNPPVLKLTHLIIKNNEHLGVSSQACTLIMDQDIIGPMNQAGGASVTGTNITIANSLIQGNGVDSGGLIGGLTVNTLDANSIIDLYNLTVVNNKVDTVTFASQGVNCSGPAGAIKISNTVSYTSNRNPAGSCNYIHSAFPQAMSDSNDNIDIEACSLIDLFVSATDFHLNKKAPAACSLIDQGIAPMGMTVFDHDLDGLSRPQGMAWDIGSYEAR